MTAVNELILEKLGVEWEPSGSGWGIARCPLHHDTSPSFSINLEKGTWKCFSGCGHGNMIDLATRLSMAGHSVNIIEILALSEDDNPIRVERKPSELTKVLASLQGPRRNTPLDEKVLSGYLPYSGFIEKRGISKEAAAFYGILFDMETRKIVITIRDHQGILRGMEGRKTDGDGPKYYPIVRCNKGNWVWGAWRFPAGLPLVVFEGALGAARAATLGVKGAVALLGSSSRPGQVERLLQASSVVIALDPDKAGEKGTAELYDSLYAGVPVKAVKLPTDIDEIESEVLREVTKF